MVVFTAHRPDTIKPIRKEPQLNYLLSPLEEHYDSGFGAMADAFREAAEVLCQKEDHKNFFEHLPIAFLLCHAVELYLKSGIVIMHRRLEIPFQNQPPDSQPMAIVDGKWKPFHQIHSTKQLFNYWKHVLESNSAQLTSVSKYPGVNWVVPGGLGESIDTIEDADAGGT